MCGIFAYVNYHVRRTTREVLMLLIGGLQRLEYRGYDSAGVCVDAAATGKPVVVRKTGNVAVLREATLVANDGGVDFDAAFEDHVGIAHTRWATHGEPCDRNAHPQFSNGKEFLVVHNGIMNNYADVKRLLLGKGFTFASDTDTEVIAVLAQYLYAERAGAVSFSELVMEVMELVDGAFAIIFKSTHYPNEFVACKRGSPLVIGIKQPSSGTQSPRHVGEGGAPDQPCEVFVASDTSSLVEHTSRVVYLDDDDVVHFGQGCVRFFNKCRNEGFQRMRSELRELHQIEMALESLSKGQYAHFMLKEIHEQPETVMNSMRGRINFATARIHLGGFTDPNRHKLAHARRILFISCGTSLHSCLAVRPIFDELTTLPISVENASDFLDRRPRIFRDDVCFFVSQSGETADTLRALEYCRDRGATLVGFTNVVGSSVSRMTEFGTHLNAGLEVGVASTKAYTSQIVALNLVALLMCEDSLRLAPRRQEIVDGLARLSADVAACLRLVDERMRALAARLEHAKSVLVLGRGYQYATCLEAALKIKELTYVHTEGINAGELKHGPLALIDENIPVIVVCTRDALLDRARSAIQQVRARRGRAIAIISAPDEEIEGAADEVLMVPATVDCLQPIVNIVPLQLLAYHLAVIRGNNVDCPRNLAKSVTTQ